jgi:hypothetical protein
LFRDEELHKKVDQLKFKGEIMSQAMDLLTQEITDVRGVVDSTLALIQKLIDTINNAATLEEVQQFVTELEVEEQKLADAVAANP